MLASDEEREAADAGDHHAGQRQRADGHHGDEAAGARAIDHRSS